MIVPKPASIVCRSILAIVTIAVTASFSGCGEETSRVAAPVDSSDQVDDYFAALPAWDSFADVFEETDQEVGEPTQDTDWDLGSTCTTTQRDLTTTPESVVTLNADSGVMWVGALIEGDGYTQGLGTMQELSIRQRSPVTLAIDLLTADNSVTVDDPTKATIGAALGGLIERAEKAGVAEQSRATYTSATGHSFEQAMLNIGLSVRYMGSGARSELDIGFSEEVSTVTAKFVQKAFSVEMVLPQVPSDVFSSDFTRERLDEQVALGNIGPDNLPVFVQSITYGRIMTYVMTSTSTVEEIHAAIAATAAALAGGGNGEVEQTHLDVLATTTVNITSIGGSVDATESMVKSGQLEDYFAAETPLTAYVPISYTLMNLADNTLAQVGETTSYQVTTCEIGKTYFSDFGEWFEAVSRTGTVHQWDTNRSNIALSQEHYSNPPIDNRGLGSKLTFLQADTSFPFDFWLESKDAAVTDEWGLVFHDQEFGDPLLNAISIGDAGDWEDDDFEVGTSGSDKVFAIGIWVDDNNLDEEEEFLAIYGINSDRAMHTYRQGSFPPGGESLPHSGEQFMGVLSPTPLKKILFNEDTGGDDIRVRNLVFGYKK